MAASGYSLGGHIKAGIPRASNVSLVSSPSQNQISFRGASMSKPICSLLLIQTTNTGWPP